MEKHDQEPSRHEHLDQSQSSPAVVGGTTDADVMNEKPRPSLHSDRKPGRFGRHSLDVRLPPLSASGGDPTIKEERSYSVPEIGDRGRASDSEPGVPRPVHAPTNIQSTRQMAVRSSAEFNRRFDGPFGRPSLAYARRTSTQVDVEEPRAGHGVGAAADAQGISVAASVGSQPELLEPEPPPLNYTLRTRKRAIFIFWSFIILDSVIMPIALYYGLWYGVGPGANTPTEKHEVLSANAVFSIVTAAIGGASILEYFVRFWRLYKKGSTCRVIGARRWYLDLFHWNFSLAWIIIMLELIIGSCQDWPPIRLLSLPLTTMLFTFGTELLLVDVLRVFRVPAPMRMSSIPKGAQLRPCIYTMIEDVVAVDGSGGTAFREALNRRYEASHVFRTMLRQLGVFWAVGAEGMAVVCIILIFTVSDDAAYAIGWSVPFAWAGVWTLCTMWYVQRELRKERAAWVEEVSKTTA